MSIDKPQTGIAGANLLELDARHIWHPFTQSQTAADPIPIVRGEGAMLYDKEGKGYLDGVSSWWVNLHGHSNPYIANRLADQARTLEHVIFAGFTHPPAVELCTRLSKHLPGDIERCFFSDNGSTSVEVAIKMAVQYWHNTGRPKTRIIALEEAYHGDTFGAMSVSGRGAFTEPFFPFLFDIVSIPTPIPGSEEASVAAMQEALQGGEVAAFIYEPLVQGAGGMRMYSPEVLDKLMGMAREADALLIADEVMVGFGRTGRFFASDWTELKPDLVAISKGLTGGTMALGITGCTQEVFAQFLSNDHSRTFFHGHSYTANPLACAVALASLDLTESEETWDSITRIKVRHEEFRKNVLDGHPLTSRVRQQGTILAFDLTPGGEQGSYFAGIRDTIYHHFLDLGILLRPLGNTVYILPPYCITDEQLDQIYAGIQALLQREWN